MSKYNQQHNTYDDDDQLPEDYELYIQGSDLSMRGNYQEAYPLLLKSAEINPHSKTYEWLYTTAKALNKPDKAFAYIETAYILNPKNNKTASMYVEELIAKDEISKARDILTDILNRSSTYGPARRLLDKLDAV